MADTVLIVDDDQSVLTMLYKVVKSNGIDAHTASSGEEALELLAHEAYDCILLDVNMHGMDGFAVVQSIRRRGLKTPIIIVSGRKEDYDTLYGLDIGADDYVTKPYYSGGQGQGPHPPQPGQSSRGERPHYRRPLPIQYQHPAVL